VAEGILAGGRIYPVPGVTVYGPAELPWILMQARDGRRRTSIDPAPQFIVNHTTGGLDPTPIIPGSPTFDILARIREVLDYWRTSPRGSQQSGAAHLVGCGKVIVQLVDVLEFITHNAGQNEVNARSVGYEMVQNPDKSVHSDTVDSCIEANIVLCDALGIPWQTTNRVYRAGTIIRRMRYGGADVAGALGHRDCSWKEPHNLTPEVRAKYPDGHSDRGRGDPSDHWYTRARARGALQFDYDQRQDIAFWMRVQAALNERYGERLKVDGVCGQRTVAAMRRRDVWNRGVFPEFPVP
jgi:hypothetical protein